MPAQCASRHTVQSRPRRVSRRCGTPCPGPWTDDRPPATSTPGATLPGPAGTHRGGRSSIRSTGGDPRPQARPRTGRSAPRRPDSAGVDVVEVLRAAARPAGRAEPAGAARRGRQRRRPVPGGRPGRVVRVRTPRSTRSSRCQPCPACSSPTRASTRPSSRPSGQRCSSSGRAPWPPGGPQPCCAAGACCANHGVRSRWWCRTGTTARRWACASARPVTSCAVDLVPLPGLAALPVTPAVQTVLDCALAPAAARRDRRRRQRAAGG